MTQVTKSNGNIVEKVLRDKEGKLIRARFFVYVDGGRIKARLLDFVYLAEQVLLQGANFLLSVSSKTKAVFKKIFNVSLTPSTYTLDPILISGSKPRAPTF